MFSFVKDYYVKVIGVRAIFGQGGAVACARLSDSIRSGNVLKAKLRRARLGKGGGGGGKIVSLQPPRVFRISYY